MWMVAGQRVRKGATFFHKSRGNRQCEILGVKDGQVTYRYLENVFNNDRHASFTIESQADFETVFGGWGDSIIVLGRK